MLLPNRTETGNTQYPDAAQAMRDRFLIITNSADDDVIDQTKGQDTGLVITGKNWMNAVAQARAADSGLLLLVDPSSASEYIATADNPFYLKQDTLYPMTLGQYLQGLRDRGVTLPMTPSRQVRAQNSAALKAIIGQANAIADRDVITLIPIVARWLRAPWISQLIAVLKTSRHPVALGLVDGRQTPLNSKAAMQGYQRLAQEVPHIIMWRTDLSGIGAVCHGASACAIGLIPSHRRYSEAGKKGHAQRPADKSPHMLLPQLLRFARSRYMTDRWFASTLPLTCDCVSCRGRAVDRLYDSPEDKHAAKLHNIAVLKALAFECINSDYRRAWWNSRLRQAQAETVTLSRRTSTDINLPNDMGIWLSMSKEDIHVKVPS